MHGSTLKQDLTFSEAGNYKDAVDQFTQIALKIDPEYLQSYLERARAFEAMNELQKAADDLQRALSFEQKKESLYYEAARLNYLLSNFDNALELDQPEPGDQIELTTVLPDAVPYPVGHRGLFRRPGFDQQGPGDEGIA